MNEEILDRNLTDEEATLAADLDREREEAAHAEDRSTLKQLDDLMDAQSASVIDRIEETNGIRFSMGLDALGQLVRIAQETDGLLTLEEFARLLDSVRQQLQHAKDEIESICSEVRARGQNE